MREFCVYTDGDTDIPEAYQERVGMLPQYYYFDPETVYGDEQVLERDAYFEILKNKRAYTSGCNPSVVRTKFEKTIAEGKDILCITFSSVMSGSYNTICTVANELMEEHKEVTIIVIDSATATLGTGFLCLDALDCADRGMSVTETAEEVKKRISKIEIYFLVDEFKYLVQGGRVSPAIGKIGDVLSIKPILSVVDGRITLFKKVRGQRMAFHTMQTLAQEKENVRVGNIFVHNQELYDRCYEAVSGESFVKLNLIISSHVGPNTVGIVLERK